MATTALRRPCPWTAPNGEPWSAWPHVDRLHALAGSLAEPYNAFLEDGGWTEDEKPEVDYRLSQVRETLAVRAALDEATSELVRNAREAGATWEQVGKALGITRQAAQMRFGK